MVIKGLILLVVTLLSGLFMIVAIFWAIVKWSNKKSRDTGCLLAILFFILAIFCGIYLVYKGVNTVIEKVPEIKEQAVESITDAYTMYYDDSPYMNSLKAMQPTDSIIPETYFTYAGFRDSYRVPLIYPYSINAIDDMEYGSLDDESGIKNIVKEKNKAKNALSNITFFAFDKNMLMAKTVSYSKAEIKYVIFHFATKQAEVFDNEVDMRKKAEVAGFDMTKSMERMSTYYYDLF